MPITRFQSAGADNAANFEEVETSATSGSSEVRELRGQLAALTDLVTQQAEAARQQTEAARRQEARMKRLEDLLLCSRQQLLGRRRALHRQHQLWTLHRERRPRRPVLRVRRLRPYPRRRRCSPRVFDGEKVDHWIVEKWLMHMEKLFRDTFVEERDRVSPTRGIRRFGIRGKLRPQFIGPYEILERVGPVTYQLALPPNLSGVHNIFHVSVLRKYIFDPAHVLDATPIELRDDLSFEEQPVRILARKVRKLRNRNIPYDDLELETDFYAYLPLCSFAHACEGRSPQAGTPEIAIATHARPCRIGCRNGMPWGRLIPRVGMLTTTGPLGTAQAGLPTESSAPVETRDHGKGVA
uniref:Tf2-1-like SH3-like domain-containing protein n=1 Tax=Ananas comosus var. bracteatus TaxID=296719 RepID=A0A6V7NJ87_ANACO|nr:unnamed protein product [Ananas comosus var. bracteatus]